MNETVEGISGVKCGVHVYRGNWSRREEVLLKGNYGPLLPYLMQMHLDHRHIRRTICQHPRDGLPQADEAALREIWKLAVDGSPVTQTVARPTEIVPEFEAL